MWWGCQACWMPRLRPAIVGIHRPRSLVLVLVVVVLGLDACHQSDRGRGRRRQDTACTSSRKQGPYSVPDRSRGRCQACRHPPARRAPGPQRAAFHRPLPIREAHPPPESWGVPCARGEYAAFAPAASPATAQAVGADKETDMPKRPRRCTAEVRKAYRPLEVGLGMRNPILSHRFGSVPFDGLSAR